MCQINTKADMQLARSFLETMKEDSDDLSTRYAILDWCEEQGMEARGSYGKYPIPTMVQAILYLAERATDNR